MSVERIPAGIPAASNRAASNQAGLAPIPVLLIALLAVAFAAPASADPCMVVDDGSGTVTLPPAGCDYLSPDEVHLIIDGLPPGTTIELAPIHKNFICDSAYSGLCSLAIPPGECEAPGGSLGGNGDCFSSELEVQLTGTGDLTGFSRLITIPIFTEVHTGPRNPGDPVQDFDTEMIQLEGGIFGDPDFDFLQIQGGTGNGLPSPGHTTLTRLGPPGSDFNVDSFFDITYTIDFQGAPGSILEGMAGTTQATIRMQAGEPIVAGNPCQVVDNGSGTVTLPPAGCEYLSPDEVHQIIDGLPPGTTLELAAIHRDFICDPLRPTPACSVAIAPPVCEVAGGSLGGNVDCFDSIGELVISGTGALAGFNRNISVPLAAEVHTGPRNPGDPVQSFGNGMFNLEGEIFGDPDFCTLRIEAGTNQGLPSPGHTTLTRLGPPGSDFQVDSFFDIAYRIEFQGCPGSILEGFGGTTTTTIRMQTGDPQGPQIDVPAFSRTSWFVLLCGLLGITGGLVVSALYRPKTG